MQTVRSFRRPSFGLGSSVVLALGAAGIAVTGASRPALAIPPYNLIGSYAEPSGTWDVAPDGRLYTINGGSIYRQAAPDSPNFVSVGSVPAGMLNAFGPSFLRVSPDGTKLAIGDGNFDASARTYIVDAAPLNTTVPSSVPISVLSTFTTPNFDATWDGNTRLYVTGARSSDFVPIVNGVDVTGNTVGTVLTDVGGASGGIAIHSGRLYTASGYVPTGEIRSFDLGSLSTSTPALFGTGSLVGSILSGSPLDFDAAGDLLVGGGDAFSGTSDIGYAAVVDLNDPAHPLHLSPNGPLSLYSPRFNATMGEVLVWDSSNSTMYRYSAIPAPAAGTLLGLAGLFAARRRRA